MSFDIFRWLLMAFDCFQHLLTAFDGFRWLLMSFKLMSFKWIYFKEIDRIFIFAVFVKKGSLCRERRGKMTAWAIKKEADFEDDFTRPVLVLRSFPPLGK